MLTAIPLHFAFHAIFAITFDGLIEEIVSKFDIKTLKMSNIKGNFSIPVLLHERPININGPYLHAMEISSYKALK